MDSLNHTIILPDTDVRITIEAQIARGWQTKRIVREMGVPRTVVKKLRSLLWRKRVIHKKHSRTGAHVKQEYERTY